MSSLSSFEVDENEKDHEKFLLQDTDDEEGGCEGERRSGGLAPVLAAGCTLWGLQLVWSAIFARGTAFLNSLGIPLSLSALLWLAGPLCGMLVQPMIGAISDSYEPAPGRNRRKPFILAGALATAGCMVGLAYIPNMTEFLERCFGTGHRGVVLAAISFFWVYGLNIAIQPLQCGVRTLLHEVCGKSAQARVAAWQGVIVAIGFVCGFLLASASFGNDASTTESGVVRFQRLSVAVSVLLLLCSAITLLCPCKTADLRKKGGSLDLRSWYSVHLGDALQRNSDCLRSLPVSIRLTLEVQFFSWMGWFPALYYQTAYLARLRKITTQVSGVQTFDDPEAAAFDSMPFAAVMVITAVALTASSQCLGKSRREGESRRSLTTLVDLWLIGHVLFALMMASTAWVTSTTQGIVMFALIGIPRALSNSVPFAIVGREVTESRDAGTLTSLHNSAISAPQILAAGLCIVLFGAAKYIGVQEETVLAMVMASVAGLLAAWRTWQLRRVIGQ